MERLEAIVSGRVQMVMYRDFVQRHASHLKLTGTVQNLPDSSVRVIAEGSQAALEKFVAKLHKGPLLACVERVDAVYTPATGAYRSFDIVYE